MISNIRYYIQELKAKRYLKALEVLRDKLLELNPDTLEYTRMSLKFDMLYKDYLELRIQQAISRNNEHMRLTYESKMLNYFYHSK